MRFLQVFKRKKLIFLNIFLFSYILINFFDGNRGFLSYIENKEQKEFLIHKKENLAQKLYTIENKNNLLSETTFVGINSADIKDHSQNNNILEVTVNFVSEIISCVRDKDKKVVSGDPEKIKKVSDTWKFSRDLRSNSPNWQLVETQA